ncbi:MAG: HlyD family type I secretion periplasmic adaptor subunit [Pseudomonadota bacterium]
MNAKHDLPTNAGSLIVSPRAVISQPAAPLYETEFDAPKRIGLTIAFLVFGVFGLWSAFAPIGGAVHAMGAISVKSYKKVVQHFEGGIVQEIRVQNGEMVEAGDILLVIDPTQHLAQLEIYTGQLFALTALEARLIAERDGLDAVSYPDLLSAADNKARVEKDAQDQVFAARKATREGAINVLNQRASQLESQVVGLEALQKTKEQLASSFAEELVEVRALLAEGFADKIRLRELERSHEMLMGEAAEITSNIAATKIQIGEAQLQIIQTQNEFQTEVVNQLAETQTNLKDTRERVIALTDIVARTEVRAPDAGIVNNLQLHTIGAVVSPGSPLAEIVPQSQDLVVEARVQITDIDRVAVGQEATIRLPTFSSKTTPTLFGKVLNVSADALLDEATRSTYYLARIEITPESMTEIEGLLLVPGMPAEVFITTPSRTFLQFVMKPLTDSLHRSFLED